MLKIRKEERAAYGRIMKLTGPIILQNLLSAAVTSADVVMLNFVGQEHISAVSLAAQYATVLFMILYGLGTGVTMLSAQYFGKGDLRAVDAVEGIALRFSVAVTAVFAAAALLAPEAMMRVFTPDPRLIEIGAGYLRNVAAAYLCWGLTEIYLATLRSVGRVGISTALNTVAFTLNILLNAVFIFGLLGAPKLGAAGVALATSISRVVELILTLIVSGRSKDVRLKLSYMFIKSKALFRDFLRMAMPATLNDVSWGLAFSMYSVIIGQFLGTDMVAANSFTSLVRTFGTVLCFSVASGGGILLGQLLGDGRMEDAEKSATALMKLTVLSGIIELDGPGKALPEGHAADQHLLCDGTGGQHDPDRRRIPRRRGQPLRLCLRHDRHVVLRGAAGLPDRGRAEAAAAVGLFSPLHGRVCQMAVGDRALPEPEMAAEHYPGECA